MLSLSTPKAGVSSSEHTTYTSLDEPTDNRSTNPPEADVPVLRDYRVCPTRFRVAVPAKSEAPEGGIEGEGYLNEGKGLRICESDDICYLL